MIFSLTLVGLVFILVLVCTKSDGGRGSIRLVDWDPHGVFDEKTKWKLITRWGP